MIAKILILINNKNIDRFFDYETNHIPTSIGDMVLINFNNKEVKGFVFELENFSTCENVKPILKIVENTKLDLETIELIKFIKSKYFYNYVKIIEVILNETILDKNKNFAQFESFYFLHEHYEVIKSKKFITFLCDININNSRKFLIENGYDNNYLAQLVKKEMIYLKKLKIDFLKDSINNEQDVSLENSWNISESTDRNYFYKSLDEHLIIEKINQIICLGIQNKKNSLIICDTLYLADKLTNFFEEKKIKIINLSKFKKEKYLSYLYELKKYLVKGFVFIGLKDVVLADISSFSQIMVCNINSTIYLKNDISKYNLHDILEFKQSRLPNFKVFYFDSTYNMNFFLKQNYLDITPKENLEEESIRFKLIDMKEELLEHSNSSIISNYLDQQIKKSLENNKKILILCNSLGHSNFVMCRECGEVLKCKFCNVSLNYSKEKKNLSCKYCNYQEMFDSICPKCGSSYIRYVGLGIEKVYEIFEEKYEKVNLYTKDKTLLNFSNIDISSNYLLNIEQMSAYSVISILNIDYLFKISKFNQNEIGFNYINSLKSKILSEGIDEFIIQGYDFNQNLLDSLKGDVKSFFAREIENRKTAKYYPFYNMVTLSIKHKDYLKVKKSTFEIFDILRSARNKEMIVLKPVYSVKDKCFKITVKYDLKFDINKVILFLNDFELQDKIEIYFDVNY